MPVQKQTRAGQRTRFKAFVAIGDSKGHIGLGVKCSKEVATAIRGAIILAKLSVVPVTGKCGSVTVRLIPAPRGTGIVSAPVPKKLLQMAGIEDCYTSARGSTGTLGDAGVDNGSGLFLFTSLLDIGDKGVGLVEMVGIASSSTEELLVHSPHQL
ncbi:hypothetical protein NQ317_012752 [Molorchus minor]|uniref:Small ribosomal subunit protein uS5 n=1 Tax=Molorchus minor TaxID=1323400 RepID=A0ABQ9K3L2_9CUCU|nr:hypothetical protein NQ317_012752 [Molorchus minor]